MNRPYSSLLCHGPDESGLQHATLLDSKIFYQWNAPVLRPICRRFLNEIKALGHEDWAGIPAEPAFTPTSPAGYQPVWNLDEDTLLPDGESQKNTEYSAKNKTCGNHPMTARNSPPIVFDPHEKIAWYCPAHFYKGDQIKEYGIHFDVARVVGMAKSISSHSPNTLSSEEAEEEWVMLALLTCTWHEVCHGWVEDICSLAESITGSDYYGATHRQYGPYILMEEALCNTAAYQMIKFFYGGGRPYAAIPSQIILDSAIQWMLSQPAGYRDFSMTGRHSPTSDQNFLHHMKRLMLEIYSIPEPIAAHAIRLFFDVEDIFFSALYCLNHKLHGNYRDSHMPKLATEQYRQHDDYPVHTHPDLEGKLS